VESGFDAETGLFHQGFDDGAVIPDAYALHSCLSGFFARRDPRRRRLVDATIAALEEGAFLRRYPPLDDGFEGQESAFLPASWWAVSALAAIGHVQEAERRADAMCAILPPRQHEQWNVQRQEPLGNTPLLWSHMETARALYQLQSARIRQRYGPAAATLWAIGRLLRLRASRRHHTQRETTPSKPTDLLQLITDSPLSTNSETSRLELFASQWGSRIVASRRRSCVIARRMANAMNGAASFENPVG
jgi:hypothetical protein